MSATPTPWREGKWGGSVVADTPNPERGAHPGGYTDADEVRDYGGYLVCESVTRSNRALIVRAVNAHDDLVAALGDALAWIVGPMRAAGDDAPWDPETDPVVQRARAVLVRVQREAQAA